MLPLSRVGTQRECGETVEGYSPCTGRWFAGQKSGIDGAENKPKFMR